MGKSEKILAMKVFLVFCFLAAASAKPQGSPAVGYADGRIIGGEEAPAHEFPWQISLRNLGSHICGGSIINKNQVITAAHCVEGGHQTRRVAKMEYHASWNNPPFNNDVALITVSEPFDFSDPNVQPIEMMKSSVYGELIPAETICNSTGWGLTNGVGLFLPNALQWAQLPQHSREQCEEIFPGYISDGMICAGGKGHATCNGDSGGPLVCPDANGVGKLAGLVSFGYTGCTDAGVYTMVSHYEEWITERLTP